MALTPVAMIVSTASLRYVLTILLDLIKAYNLFRRDEFMDILNEDNSVETAKMMEKLQKPSIMMTVGDKTKLTKMMNVRLTQSGPAPLAL